jgi:two-component system, NarL family, response regulator DegU
MVNAGEDEVTDEIRLVVADDHPIVRQGLCQILAQDSELKILAAVGDGQHALESVKSLEPDILLTDIDMPLLNGFELARAIAGLNLQVSIIFLTVHCEEEFFNEALALGAKGYVLKDSAVTDIVAAIRAVAAGQNYVSNALTAFLFKRRSSTPAQRSHLEDLTPTERQIVKLIAEYKTSKEIAAELFISPHTVQTHRKNICIKLKLEGNHALMKFALENKARL